MAEDGYNKFLSYLQNTETTTNGIANGNVSTKQNNGIKVQILSPDEEDADACTDKRSSLDISSRRSKLSRRASTTEERRNPFAEREGNALMWSNVNMTLSTKQGEKKLLNDVWGEVPPGEITAIMGPSGAGKSSLLNVLAGRSRSTAKLNVQAEIRMNEYQVDPTNIEVRKQIAFVAQDDSLSFTATPREAIRFSAKLRLPRVTTDDEIEELADRMLAELGLKDCADTIVGGSLIKGISGGERKRTSVGVELVTKPSLVFLDGEISCISSSGVLSKEIEFS
jgi:ABC-type lipoprotein export system ATPase subunit